MQRTETCPKCRSTDLAQGELRGAGGFLSAWFDFATRRFKTITCRGCKYTEFYAADDHIPS